MSLFDDVSAGKVEHFFQCGVAGKYTFGLCHFPIMAVQPVYDICGIHDPPDVTGKL